MGWIDNKIKKKISQTIDRYTPRLIWSVIVMLLLIALALTLGIWLASEILTF